MRYIDKKLVIEKTSIENISKKFGTPTYCYSYKKLKENINNFKKNFRSFSPLICFAVKSNTNINLIREIKQFGLGADVVSMGELMIAIKAGINPKKIVFSGVGKTSSEISYAIDKKILLINAESKSEIKEIERIAKIKRKKNTNRHKTKS
jgi:diaminopimelate decarboxylase